MHNLQFIVRFYTICNIFLLCSLSLSVVIYIHFSYILFYFILLYLLHYLPELSRMYFFLPNLVVLKISSLKTLGDDEVGFSL